MKHRVIILAAGMGSRLKPYTNEIPKCMVKVNGKSILEYQLELFQNKQINKINIVGGYKIEKLKKYGLPLIYNENYDSTNMVYSLYKAIDLLKGNIIISYGDIIYSEETLKTLLNSDGDIVIASDKNWKSYWSGRMENVLSDVESFSTYDKNFVKELGKKPKSLNNIEGQYIGLIKLSAKGSKIMADTLKEGVFEDDENIWNSGKNFRDAYMTDLLNNFAKNKILKYCEINRGWFEIDSPSDLDYCEKEISF